eukprot:5946372-Amphidinium_carterae.1
MSSGFRLHCLCTREEVRQNAAAPLNSASAHQAPVAPRLSACHPFANSNMNNAHALKRKTNRLRQQMSYLLSSCCGTMSRI